MAKKVNEQFLLLFLQPVLANNQDWTLKTERIEENQNSKIERPKNQASTYTFLERYNHTKVTSRV